MTYWRAEDFTDIRGILTNAESLSRHTWLGVGGPADLYFEPADEADLAAFLSQADSNMPLLLLGAGSNMLVRDGGVEGCVIHLGDAFSAITQDGDSIIAGAGVTDAALARAAGKWGRGGLSFLVSIPGTIGGGLRMNAGCYGSEFKDVVQSARIMLRDGTIVERTPAEMGMSYRHSDVEADAIFLSARFHTTAQSVEACKAEMKEMLQKRAETQPQGVRTGGSTFANPDGDNAWRVIDAAGGRGLQVGGAHMSEKHCNFMINSGTASARDLEELGEEIRRRVVAHSGISLRWEIKLCGRAMMKETKHA